MSETSWTPAPWRVAGDEGIGTVIVASGDTGVPDIVCDFLDADADEAEIAANAHLIAAAPELYEALAAMCRQFTSGNPDQREVISAARAALDKARGEPR